MKQFLMLAAIVVSTWTFWKSAGGDYKGTIYRNRWLFLVLVFLITSHLGPFIYDDLPFTIGSIRQAGTLLFIGLVPTIFGGILMVQFSGGYRRNREFINNAIFSLALAQFIGRLGCLFDDCCTGIVCANPSPLTIYSRHLEAHTLNVVGLELAMLVLYFVLRIALSIRHQVISVLYYIMANALFRFTIDPFRSDEQLSALLYPGGHAQELSIILFLLSLWLLGLYRYDMKAK